MVPQSYLIKYNYIEDFYYKRIPYMKQHIQLVEKYEKKGVRFIGGTKFPYNGAVLYMQTVDSELPQRFVNDDPFFQNGMVVNYEINGVKIMNQNSIDDSYRKFTYRP